MKDIKYLLWDIDGTLLNFEMAEEAAMKELFLKYKLGELSEDLLSDYQNINRKYWEALERGEITKPEVLVGRFKEFFEKNGFDSEIAPSFNEDYQVALGSTVVYNPNAKETVLSFVGKYKQFAVTNGTTKAQVLKLKNSGLDQILDGVFISEEVGVEKPGVGFFDKVFEEVGSDNLNEYLIIGDSLTSDIQGGNNCGIKTCWFNPKGNINKTNLRIDIEISDIGDLKL
ncbi:MAG: YjjG family noncanonical pyrimidine nucleotidase [Lachnospiraceae bacterium]|nr:YjjG family noncanonical pyrimidine nucleotidase [Lachnospiraceae bacterium]